MDEFIENPDLENVVASHIKYYSKSDLKEMRDYYYLISTTIRNNQTKGESKKLTFESLDYSIIDERFNVFT